MCPCSRYHRNKYISTVVTVPWSVDDASIGLFRRFPCRKPGSTKTPDPRKHNLSFQLNQKALRDIHLLFLTIQLGMKRSQTWLLFDIGTNFTNF